MIFLFFKWQGKRLTQGAGINDYIVTIGESPCVIKDLTDNRIQCKPPKHEPDEVKTGAHKSGKPRLFVSTVFI